MGKEIINENSVCGKAASYRQTRSMLSRRRA